MDQDKPGKAGIGRVLVVLPTYNERENLSTTLNRLRESMPTVHILVVDDSSPDGTGEEAEHLSANDDHVHVLHRTVRQGLGAAYLDGFGWGLRHGFDVIVEMDADGSHQPEELPRLLAGIGAGADLVIGSRWVPGGEVRNWPRHRALLSRGGNAYARMMTGIPVRDSTAGYRAFRRTALERIGIDRVESQGYCFQIDLAWRAVQAGLRVDEVPITFVERELGVSKMRRGIVLEALWRVTGWGARRRVQQLAGHRHRTAATEDAPAEQPEAELP